MKVYKNKIYILCMDENCSKKKQQTKDNKFMSLRDAIRFTGIGAQTLRKLSDEQKIMCYKTPSNQRKFNTADLEAMCFGHDNINKTAAIQKRNFIYARVSSRKQMDDLSRQIEYIRSKHPEYASYELITDITSGINFIRPGLSKILDACLFGIIGQIIVAHKDRLCRFGFDFIRLIVEKRGGKIIVLDDEQNKSTEQELSEDLLSIIHVYSCKQMGKRSYRIKKSCKNIDTSNNGSKEDS